jgi:hypothetical protein
VTDERKLGPFGAGGESQPATVDLTRIDIRRGTLYLPRRFYGALPEGELRVSDGAAGRSMTITFRPPRQLEGLGPFYEEHDLRPNDAVALQLGDELRLTPVRRDRQRVGAEAASEREASPAPETIPAPPPPPEVKGGWQDVLHDPAPRRPHPGGVSKPALAPAVLSAVPSERPSDLDPVERLGPDERIIRSSSPVSRLDSLRPEARVQAGRPLERQSRPPAPEVDRTQKGLFEGRPVPRADGDGAGGGGLEERVAVTVGAAPQTDAAGRIADYLADPGTPAIVRASAVAEALHLPLEAVQRGLAEVSRASDGSVAPIRPDVYLVKRGVDRSR